MPRGDRTGPRGEGPRTGRALGFCVGGRDAGFRFYRGFRGGFRGGMRGRRFQEVPEQDASNVWSPWDRISELEEELDALKEELTKLKS